MLIVRRRYFVLAIMWREWWIGTRYDFMRDAWHYNLFGLSLFINNEFWWMLSGKRYKPRRADGSR